jgi:hypothetical protein
VIAIANGFIHAEAQYAYYEEQDWCGVAGLLALPLTAQAKGVPGGAARGAEEGGQALGAAAAGAVVKGVTGGVAGQQVCFRQNLCGYQR